MAEHKAMLWGRFVTTAPETSGCKGCEFHLRPREGYCSGKAEEAAGFKRCDKAKHIYVLAQPDQPTIGVDLANQPDQTIVTTIKQQDNASAAEQPTAKKHPHDAVIRAWLDGKTVQVENVTSAGQWLDISPPPAPVAFNANAKFRIKPATKTLRFRVALMNSSGPGGWGHYAAAIHKDSLGSPNFVRWLDDDWREVEVKVEE